MPYDCDPLSSAETPFYFQNFLTRSVTADLTGAAVYNLALAANAASAVFPIAVKVAEIDLQTNAGLIGLTLSTSITNYTASSTCGIFFGLDNGPASDVNGMSRLFLNHICGQNASSGIPAAASRTNSIQMGQNSAYRVNSGQKFALYMSAPNDAYTLLTAVASIYWINI
jgi:hypothetical protein